MTEDRFIRRDEVERLVALSRSQIYEMAKHGDFPRPIKLGSASRWSLVAVRAWMAEQLGKAG